MPLIRRGEYVDIPAIEAIQNASPEAARWPVSEYFNYELLVAETQGTVAGFLCARATAEGESEVLNLAISPEFRRKGVGRALLRAFAEEHRGDVFLEVRQSNQDARNFYKAFGFKELAIRKDYYQHPCEHCIVMKLYSC